MNNPYRDSWKPPTEPPKPWWEDETPTEEERELWVQFYITFVQSSRVWKVDESVSPCDNADAAMSAHRKRFGVVK
jgi:hypothetical protein